MFDQAPQLDAFGLSPASFEDEPAQSPAAAQDRALALLQQDQQQQRADRPMLSVGSQGPAVVDLQTRLNQRGEALVPDGVFGSLTRAAVVRFQTASGLSPDGVVGPLTWGALDAATGPAAPAPSPGGEPGGEEPLLNKPGGSQPQQTGPVLDDLGGQGDNVAVGDAEGNGGDPGRTLETLDRDGEPTSEPTGLASVDNQFGFLPGTAPARPAPVAHASKASLLAGAFADSGAYRSEGDGFTNAQLDELLAAYGAFWGVDVREKARADDEVLKPGAGDSAGKGVGANPPWVKTFQNKIIGRAKWDDDDRATQKIVEAFLRRFAAEAGGELPPGAEQLFHQIGGSETNGQAQQLGGFKGAGNWCAQASHVGLILGMYNRGIRFKTNGHSNKYGAELQKQITAYSKWTKQAGSVVSGTAAHTAQLEPGDIISVVNGGPMGPLSGHVATVVDHESDKIVYVSGNAAGVHAFEGAVRIEEVKREQPPAGYDWMTMASREKTHQGHKQAEKDGRANAQKNREAMSARLNFILSNLDPLVVPPNVDLNNPASVAVLIAFLSALPSSDPKKAALLGNAQEILQLSMQTASEEGKANQAAAAQAAMMNDGGLPVDRTDKRFVPGVHAPKEPGVSWVVEVIRASALTQATMLANGSHQVVPTDPALETGPRLIEQCPDTPPEVINQSAK